MRLVPVRCGSDIILTFKKTSVTGTNLLQSYLKVLLKKDRIKKVPAVEAAVWHPIILGGEIVYNHADYRLVSARVLKEFANFKEVNLFLRGMIPLVGFKSTSVYYERHERLAGESHYPLSKMLALAFDGITSLSVKPIRLITGFGLGVSALSFIGIIWAVIATILGKTVAGWSSTVCIVCFMGGIQLICLGVLGEYIGKIYMEVKARPRYIISERTWEKDEKEEQKKCSK